MAYKVTIGLEVHCELTTKAKVFSRGINGYSDVPNSLVNKIDMGFPGIMPYPNKSAVKQALKTALCLNSKIPEELIFDRKNYYYVDLPKGYQLTQDTNPIGKGGYLDIRIDDIVKRIEIDNIHLEEDTASLDHHDSYSLLDYNRSGIPLLETVTTPCIHSAEEAVKFLEEIRRIFLYCGISEADSKKGQMRCDVNISLQREGQKELGTKVEMKNINSFSNVKEAIEYEIKRQSELLDENKDSEIIQETRRFDDNTGKSYPMRSKVDAIDYKYFIEPNIMPIKIEKSFIEEVKKEIPMLAFERENMYIEQYGITPYDAAILVKEKKIADYFEEVLSYNIDPKLAANWVSVIILGSLNKLGQSIDNFFITPLMLSNLIKLVSDKKVSLLQGKKVLYEAIEKNIDPLDIIKASNIEQIGDEEVLRKLVIASLDENPEVVSQYKEGKEYVVNFFVGPVMKKTKGQANPQITISLIKEELKKR